jgi:hypothetical protein
VARGVEPPPLRQIPDVLEPAKLLQGWEGLAQDKVIIAFLCARLREDWGAWMWHGMLRGLDCNERCSAK